MYNPIIKINDDMPDNDSVNISQSSKVLFQSDDKNKYYIDFDASDRGSISNDQFPIEVPANGSTVQLNIKSDAEKRTFMYKILDANQNQVWPELTTGVGDVPPQIIID